MLQITNNKINELENMEVVESVVKTNNKIIVTLKLDYVFKDSANRCEIFDFYEIALYDCMYNVEKFIVNFIRSYKRNELKENHIDLIKRFELSQLTEEEKELYHQLEVYCIENDGVYPSNTLNIDISNLINTDFTELVKVEKFTHLINRNNQSEYLNIKGMDKILGSGKWLIFNNDAETVLNNAIKIIESDIVREVKYPTEKFNNLDIVLCIYNNIFNIETHKELINYMIDNNIIEREQNKEGKFKYKNISYKLDVQTEKEYDTGNGFFTEDGKINTKREKICDIVLNLSDFIDLETGVIHENVDKLIFDKLINYMYEIADNKKYINVTTDPETREEAKRITLEHIEKYSVKYKEIDK